MSILLFVPEFPCSRRHMHLGVRVSDATSRCCSETRVLASVESSFDRCDAIFLHCAISRQSTGCLFCFRCKKLHVFMSSDYFP